MDEYPEYDFYNSREECDGKEGWGGERKKRRQKGRWKRTRRKETGQGGRQDKKNLLREDQGKKTGYKGEKKDK